MGSAGAAGPTLENLFAERHTAMVTSLGDVLDVESGLAEILRAEPATSGAAHDRATAVRSGTP